MNCAAVTQATCELAGGLKRGINLGNMLEAPREGDWGVKVEPRFIEAAASKFSTVRLPVRWTNHAAKTADATLDEAFATRVDGVVDALLDKGVNVILDLHHYNQINGDKVANHEFAVDPSVLDERLINIWRQLGARYKNKSKKLIFEIMNEPHGVLNGDPWNALLLKALAAIRETNPHRAVIIGPTYWNATRDLVKLKMPADRNIIATVHSYDPMGFTHQGVSWMAIAQPVGTTCCSAAQKKQITDALDIAKKWSDANGYPVLLGEFGTIDKAPMESREAYARIVRDEAERRGFAWTYWELASSFGMFNPATNTWVEPIRRALLD